MEIWQIILLILLGALIILTTIYFIIVHKIFNVLFKRMDKEILLTDVKLEETHYKPFMDKVIHNMNEFMAIPYEEVSIESKDGLKLFGKYYQNKDSKKTCIFFHGYHADPYNNINTPGLFLLNEGYNILCITERSHGKSEGKYITFGVKEKEDALLWFSFLNEKYNPEEILVWGVSMGCGVVEMVSDRLPSNVKALILDCGFTGAYEMVSYSCKKKNRMSPLFMPGICLLCHLKGHFKLEKKKAYEALSKTNLPCFFIHGKEDLLVPIAMGRENYSQVKGPKYFFETAVGHAVSIYPYEEEIEGKIKEFLEQYAK